MTFETELKSAIAADERVAAIAYDDCNSGDLGNLSAWNDMSGRKDQSDALTRAGILPVLQLDKLTDSPACGSNENVDQAYCNDNHEVRKEETREERKDDGSVVSRDAAGRVSAVTYPDGQTKRTFEYDQQSKLVGFTDIDGTYWKRANNGKWLQYEGRGGKPTGKHHSGEFTVAADGTFIDDGSGVKGRKTSVYETTDGSRITRQNDSFAEVAEKADGSVVYKNQDGKVTKVVYPDGKTTREFEYDKDGKLTAFTDIDGKRWEREQASGQWRGVDPRTHRFTGPTHNGDFRVEDDGTFVDDGSRYISRRTTVVETTDGNRMELPNKLIR